MHQTNQIFSCLVSDIITKNSYNVRLRVLVIEHIFKGMWGSKGSGDGEFQNPHSIAVDSNDDIYVTDLSNDYVQKFTRTGDFIRKWGSSGSGDGQFRGPRGIASFSGNSILVVDHLNHRI